MTETVLTGLKPNTEYSFRIKAFNRRGDGAFSQPIKMITRGLRNPLFPAPQIPTPDT